MFFITRILNVLVLSQFFTSFDIRNYLPLAVSFINCLIKYLKFEQLNKKKSFLWYGLFFLISTLSLTISHYYFPIIFESLNNYVAMLHNKDIYIQSLLPTSANETYDGRLITDLLSMNALNPNNWTIYEKRNLLDKLLNNFDKFSLDCTKGEAAYLKHILKKNNVAEPWVQFNNSNTNRFPLYKILHNSQYKQMVLAESELINTQIRAKFKVGNEDRSILN